MLHMPIQRFHSNKRQTNFSDLDFRFKFKTNAQRSFSFFVFLLLLQHIAASKGSVECAVLLLDFGADPNIKGTFFN